MVEMHPQSVVITGSSRGIGYGLAREFLKLGHYVTISGRSEMSTKAALDRLSNNSPTTQLLGHACDVQHLDQLEALWFAAVARFGHIDIWVNNAGLTMRSQEFWHLSKTNIDEAVQTNLVGVMYGSGVALRGMFKQQHGALYNMEGLGSDGKVFSGSSLYSATKSALTTLTKGLIKETRGTPVRVGFINPGIVVTDLVTDDPENVKRNRWVLNILADRVETVTPYLVNRMLQNTNHGARISWLPLSKVLLRFMLAPLQKRDLFFKGEDA